MPVNQIHPSAWTPVRTTALIGFLTSDGRSPHDTDDDSSTNGDDEPILHIPRTPWSSPTDRLVIRVVKKVDEFKVEIASLQALFVTVKAQNATLCRRTYTPQWRIPWPSKLRNDYESYKKDDANWRALRKVLDSHCSSYYDLQLGSPAFSKRLSICIDLGDAAMRTARGRLQFMQTYPAAFPRFEQIASHIHEGSKALTSARVAANELASRKEDIFLSRRK